LQPAGVVGIVSAPSLLVDVEATGSRKQASAKLPHPLLVSPAPVRTRAKQANGRGTMTAGAVLGLRQILYETVRGY